MMQLPLTVAKATSLRRPGRAGRHLLGQPLLLVLLLLLLGASACQKAKPTADTAAAVAYYTCPMHAQIHEDAPGSCPICHMDLVAVAPVAQAGAPAPTATAETTAAEAAAHSGGYTCPMHPQVQAAARQLPHLPHGPRAPARHRLPGRFWHRFRRRRPDSDCPAGAAGQYPNSGGGGGGGRKYGGSGGFR
ncbi:heavy metal-binding domain-containing protein [Hymenobacter amundsenii]|uniref:heavy metal-binding domain-containing protein n=1 Tax=Hymenobacter amundsenii TaxID=2006685 RepID=UPI001F5B969E|nr:heavy metal-binding domain-containing protein [Hymenobacter amundsenii]